jgi:hypothetical protein
MKKVESAIAGVVLSAGCLTGAFVLDHILENGRPAAVANCYKPVGGVALDKSLIKDCVSDVSAQYDDTFLGLVGIASTVGFVGCGYLTYKAIKQNIGTTGVLEDLG